MRWVLRVMCVAPFATDMAVCFLLSVILSCPLRWENHHLLCFDLTHVPPKATLLSCYPLPHLLLLMLAFMGMASQGSPEQYCRKARWKRLRRMYLLLEGGGS